MADVFTRQAVGPKKKGPGRLTLIDWFWGYFFVVPVFAGVVVFSCGPVLFSFGWSLTKWDGLLSSPEFIGFGNFIQLLGDKLVKLELRNTLIYAAWTVPIQIAISTVLAVLMNSIVKGKSFFRVVYFLPVVTMPVAIATVWRYLFNSQYGLINYLFRPFGLNPQWIGDPKYVMPALIVIAVWSHLGNTVILLTAGLQNIPATYYEAAEIDGAGPAHRFFRLTIPLLSPTIFFLFVTQMMNAWRTFDLVYVLLNNSGAQGSAGPVSEAIRTMVFGIYERAFIHYQMGYASANAVVLFAIILIITLFQFALQKKLVFYE